MSLNNLTVLGTFAFSVETHTLVNFPTEKARALFIYLALEPYPHRREALSELLWPNNPPGMAMKNLRQTLYRLRHALQQIDPQLADQILDIQRYTIQIRPESLSVDALRFQQLITRYEQHAHESLYSCKECFKLLSQAIAEYKGELLPLIVLPDAPEFEEWLLGRREILHNMALLALSSLIHILKRRGDYQQALHYAQQAITLDPNREAFHQQVMTLFSLLGQPQHALLHYQNYYQKLQREFNLKPSAEIEELNRRIQRGELTASTILEQDSRQTGLVSSTSNQVHSVLPARLTKLIGRQRELNEVGELIGAPHNRLVTISAMGGMGKTRLALEFAHLQLNSYRNGAVFLALDTLSDPTTIPAQLLIALGLDLRDNALSYITRYLQDKELLLVLDNAEHLLKEVSELCLTLLATAPQLRILVTSREPLRIRGEQVYRLSALDSDETGKIREQQHAAVSLFIQSAQRVQAYVSFNENDYNAIHKICHLVEGLPLAIELAAAWVDFYSCQAIAEAIQENVDFLMFDWRDVPTRQQSMRGVFEWSWKLLKPEEQESLKTMALFQGGCTLEAAQSIARISPSILNRLCQSSLIQISEHPNGKRYTMHRLLRQFALEHFTDQHERYEAELRHCRYYLAFAAAREERLAKNDPRAAAAEIWDEIDNIRQAWIWAAQHGHFDEIANSLNAFYHFYMVTALLVDRVHMFEIAYRALSKLDPYNNDDWQIRQLYGKLSGFYSIALVRNAQNKQAKQIIEQLFEHEQAGQLGLVLAHMAHSYYLFNQGEFRAARDAGEQALALNSKVRNSDKEGMLLSAIECGVNLWLTTINLNLSEYKQALRHAQYARAVCSQHDQPAREVDCLLGLGNVAQTVYKLSSAQDYYEQARMRAASLTTRTGESRILFGLGEVLRLQGDYGQAHKILEQALKVTDQTNDFSQTYQVKVALMRLNYLMGNQAQLQFWEQQLSLQEHNLVPPTKSFMMQMALSGYLLQNGQFNRALQIAEAGWKLAQRICYTYDQAHSLLVLAHARAALRRPDAEITYFQALEYYNKLEQPGLAAEAWAGVALIALDRQDLTNARQACLAILQIIDTGVRIGLDEPFFTYQACYEVLRCCGDPRAKQILAANEQLIDTYLAKIDNPTLHAAFIERVNNHPLLVRQKLPLLDQEFDIPCRV